MRYNKTIMQYNMVYHRISFSIKYKHRFNLFTEVDITVN